MRWPETLEQIHFLSTHHSKWEGQQTGGRARPHLLRMDPGTITQGPGRNKSNLFLSSVDCSAKAQSWRFCGLDINILNNGGVPNSRNFKNLGITKALATQSRDDLCLKKKKPFSWTTSFLPVSILIG